MMEFMTSQHSVLLLLVLVPLSQRPGNHWSHSSSSICVGASSMIVGFSLDPLGGLGYAPKERDASTREGSRRDPHIGVGDNSTIMGVVPSPQQGLLDQGHGLTSLTQMAMGIRCEGVDSTAFGVELVNNRADGPCCKQVFSDLKLWQPP